MVFFDPGELELGEYNGQVTIECDDPDTPTWDIPVTMTVIEPYICGDLNDDGVVNLLDIVFLINYKYKEGVVPDPMESADVNGDGSVNILDIVYLINFKYKDGPAPDCP